MNNLRKQLRDYVLQLEPDARQTIQVNGDYVHVLHSEDATITVYTDGGDKIDVVEGQGAKINPFTEVKFHNPTGATLTIRVLVGSGEFRSNRIVGSVAPNPADNLVGLGQYSGGQTIGANDARRELMLRAAAGNVGPVLVEGLPLDAGDAMSLEVKGAVALAVGEGGSGGVAVSTLNASASAYKSTVITPEGNIEHWGRDEAGDQAAIDAVTNPRLVAGGNGDYLLVDGGGDVSGYGSDGYSIISGIPGGLTDVVGISMMSHALALTGDGSVYGWGRDDSGQATVPGNLGDSGPVVQVVAAGNASLALHSDGSITAWGNDYWNQVAGAAAIAGAVQIVGGEKYGMARHSDGTVTAWGDDTAIVGNEPASSDIVQIAGGRSHALALHSDGSVTAWGDNANGQTDVPAGLDPLAGIVANPYGGHTLAVTRGGEVVAWGRDDDGQSTVPVGSSIAEDVEYDLNGADILHVAEVV